MQVIPDSLFACPDPTPMWGGKKGELRDWTTGENVMSIVNKNSKNENSIAHRGKDKEVYIK